MKTAHKTLSEATYKSLVYAAGKILAEGESGQSYGERWGTDEEDL
jgi:hypothetical protein